MSPSQPAVSWRVDLILALEEVGGYHYIHKQPTRFEFLIWEANSSGYKSVYSTLSQPKDDT